MAGKQAKTLSTDHIDDLLFFAERSRHPLRNRLIVLLSGHVSSGKTTLCGRLDRRFGVDVFRTKDLIRELAGNIEAERGAMQVYGT